ncbi:hypothetical protein [Paenibacillus sp. SI8]|uniref:nitric oxide reductase activation protein NorD n=1 Tax=unclassified Paenibacillus TaxID=185978 RepID=UPI0034655EF2
MANQLFALCEDMRLEQICRRRRPGTVRVFAQRHRIYASYYKHKLSSHLKKGELGEAFILLIYGWFTGAEWGSYVHGEQLHELTSRMAGVYPLLEQVEEAEHTSEVASCCERIMDSLSYWLQRDTLVQYFWMQPESGTENPLAARHEGELKRAKRLANEDVLPEQEGERQLPGQERMPTWHRESSDRTPGLLRFELERGSRTAAAGDTPREGDAADQALAIAQGRSLRAQRTGAAGERRQSFGVPAAAGHGEGAAGMLATATWLAPERPSAAQEAAYRRLSERVAPLAKPLQRAIRRTLERKRIAPRGDQLFGRLDKRLTRAVTQEAPRLFYKKRAPVPQLDAAFALLVDCSASMYDKMDETKLGLVMFHETLRDLRIPHEVVGFWEDADRVTEKEAPNLFQVAMDFASSCASGCGAALLQLEPQQDNRDGFAIRRMCERLLRRSERQRVLLVFSDGEPSAADYNDAGILDTHEAVLQARRLGIEVISVFLANGAVHETQQKAMRNIYGRSSIVVPNIEELPQQLAPILRKLLLKSIF